MNNGPNTPKLAAKCFLKVSLWELDTNEFVKFSNKFKMRKVRLWDVCIIQPVLLFDGYGKCLWFMTVFEVQAVRYFDEDDITRYENVYERVQGTKG